MKPHYRVKISQLILVLFGLIIGLSVAESFIRLGNLSLTWNMKQEEARHHAIIENFVDDYYKIGYRYIPNSTFISVRDKAYQINSLGFRDDEPSTDTSKVKVAIIGDSVFEGFGVEKSDRASDIAETTLSTVGIDNFCVSGSSTLDQLTILENHVLSTNPKYVILQMCFNDFRHNHSQLTNPDKKVNNQKVETFSIKYFLQNYSAFYLFLAEQYSFYKLTNDRPNELLTSILEIETTQVDSTFGIINQFKKICIKNRITPVVLYSPYEAEIRIKDNQKGLWLSTKIDSFCENNQLKFINLTPFLRCKDEKLFFDQCHLNETGNKLVGKYLANELTVLLNLNQNSLR